MGEYTHYGCPLCGWDLAISTFDPEFKGFISVFRFYSKGRARGFDKSEIVEIFNMGDSWLRDAFVSKCDSIANYLDPEGEKEEDAIEEEAQVLSDICEELRELFPDGFNNLADAAISLLEVHQELVAQEEISEEEEDQDTFEGAYDNNVNDDNEPVSDLEREILIGEKEIMEPV